MANQDATVTGRAIYVFGLERIGGWTIAKPGFATALVAMLTALSLISVARNLRYDGDISRALASQSEPFQELLRLERDFRPFSSDEVVLVRSPNLRTVAGFETLRELHLELQFVEEIEFVVSVFSLVERDDSETGWHTSLAGEIRDDGELSQRLSALFEKQPVARALLAPESGLALFMLLRKPKGSGETPGFSAAALKEINDTFALYRDHGVEAQLLGRASVEREIVGGLKRDQIIISAFGILVCAIMALVLFRTVAAAIVCTLPTLLTVVFYLGFISAIGIDINLLTTVIPALIIVMAFADTLHLFFHWQRFCDGGDEPHKAIKRAAASIGPACALASITTAIAFSALLVASNEALNEMALSGIAGVLIVFLAVIVVTPLTLYWSLHFRASFKPVAATVLYWASNAGQRWLDRSPGATTLAALILTALLTIAHFSMPSHFNYLDYTSRDSVVRTASCTIDAEFGGAGQLFAVVPREKAGETITTSDVRRLSRTEDVLKQVFGARKVVSLASAAQGTEDQELEFDLASVPKSARPGLTRFISRERDRLLVTVFVSYGISAKHLLAQIEEAESKLKRANPEFPAKFAGAPLYRSITIPKLVVDLRHGLLLSVVFSILVIALAARSWRLGLACFLPNILPILAVEVGVWLFRGGIDVTAAIALTIGFGLAIDDSVHLLNHFLIEKPKAASKIAAMHAALHACSPALIATTLVLGVGMSVSLFSTFPTIVLFALIVIAILIFALAADILVLPSVATRIDR